MHWASLRAVLVSRNINVSFCSTVLCLYNIKYYFPKIFIMGIHGAHTEVNPVAIGVSGCRQVRARVGAVGNWYNFLPQWKIWRPWGLRACPGSQRVSGRVEADTISCFPVQCVSQQAELCSVPRLGLPHSCAQPSHFVSRMWCTNTCPGHLFRMRLIWRWRRPGHRFCGPACLSYTHLVAVTQIAEKKQPGGREVCFGSCLRGIQPIMGGRHSAGMGRGRSHYIQS